MTPLVAVVDEASVEEVGPVTQPLNDPRSYCLGTF